MFVPGSSSPWALFSGQCCFRLPMSRMPYNRSFCRLPRKCYFSPRKISVLARLRGRRLKEFVRGSSKRRLMPRRPRVDIFLAILYWEGRKPLDPLCGLFGTTVDYKIGGGNVDDCDVQTYHDIRGFHRSLHLYYA